jgi:hypothetical protein
LSTFQSHNFRLCKICARKCFASGVFTWRDKDVKEDITSTIDDKHFEIRACCVQSFSSASVKSRVRGGNHGNYYNTGRSTAILQPLGAPPCLKYHSSFLFFRNAGRYYKSKSTTINNPIREQKSHSFQSHWCQVDIYWH